MDLREIAAEKIAAFWRRHKARDLYDLEHLGRVLQHAFDGPAIGELAALKIYFDVVDEGLGQAPSDLVAILGCRPGEVEGIGDLGRFRAGVLNVERLLGSCALRYGALSEVHGEILRLATTCSPRDRHRALDLRGSLVTRLVLGG